MKNYKISIPKPCHENWNVMTPNEKGKFCKSCAKTVVDFTQKTPSQIQEYLLKKKDQKVCGHFYRKQLDSIVIQIPETAFFQTLPFQKMFVLLLFIVMGTTLFSCKTDTNKRQKIEKVELIDSLKSIENKLDSLAIIESDCATRTVKDTVYELQTMGLVIDGEISLNPENVDYYSFNIVDIPPRFLDTKKGEKRKLKAVFERKMKEFIIKNFDVSVTENLGLRKGKKRMLTRFMIDNTGNVTDIQIRAPHLKLKKYVGKMLEKLPKFFPGENKGKKVNVQYTLPITFMVE